MLFDHIKYKNINEFPHEQYPQLSDQFVLLHNSLKRFDEVPQIKGIVSLYPAKPRKRKIDFLRFFSLNTNRTKYAALKLLEEAFADFYLETEILPIITPLHFQYIKHYKRLPSQLIQNFQRRGVILYDIET